MQKIGVIYLGNSQAHHNHPPTIRRTFKVNMCPEQLVTISLFSIQNKYPRVKKERGKKNVPHRVDNRVRKNTCCCLCKSCYCSSVGDGEWTIQILITAQQEISVGKMYLIARVTRLLYVLTYDAEQ